MRLGDLRQFPTHHHGRRHSHQSLARLGREDLQQRVVHFRANPFGKDLHYLLEGGEGRLARHFGPQLQQRLADLGLTARGGPLRQVVELPQQRLVQQFLPDAGAGWLKETDGCLADRQAADHHPRHQRQADRQQRPLQRLRHVVGQARHGASREHLGRGLAPGEDACRHEDVLLQVPGNVGCVDLGLVLLDELLEQGVQVIDVRAKRHPQRHGTGNLMILGGADRLDLLGYGYRSGPEQRNVFGRLLPRVRRRRDHRHPPVRQFSQCDIPGWHAGIARDQARGLFCLQLQGNQALRAGQSLLQLSQDTLLHACQPLPEPVGNVTVYRKGSPSTT